MILYATLNSKNNKRDGTKSTCNGMHIAGCKLPIQQSGNPTQQSKLLNRLIKFAFVLITTGLLAFFLYITIPSMYLPHNEVALLTPHGWISGIKNEISEHNTIYTFKGIPYAQPPIGKLRFHPPVPYSGTNVKYLHKAHKSGPLCVQLNNEGALIGDENCLFLNVFTPTLNKGAYLPVLVWIHGGNLISGSADTANFSLTAEFVTSMNVVAVSMNYRLNAFGFLTLKELWDEGKSYGNYGILDQILALEWIQSNIKNFGGDPNSVTLLGQGSGGTSVLALLASPVAEGLFHKAVSMSGSPRFDITYKEAANHNRVFIKNSKCRDIPATFIKECLLNLTTYEIMKAIPLYEFPNWGNRDVYDIPKMDVIHEPLIVIDPIVVTKQPADAYKIKYKTKTKIPVILGSTAQEICFNPAYRFQKHSLIELKDFLKRRFHPFSRNLYNDLINKRYKKIINNNPSPQYLYETIATDIRLTCPTNKLFNHLLDSKKHIPYQYVVTNRPSKPIQIADRKLQCAFHGWDVLALFGFPHGYIPDKRDKKFQKHLRETLRYFMVTGRIPHYSKHERIFKYTRDGTMQRILHNYHHHQCKAWTGFEKYSWIN